MTDTKEVILDPQIVRLRSANVKLSADEEKAYLKAPDVLKGDDVPLGYKRCGKCGRVLKFYLYNQNNSSKTNTTGNCKACQKETAKKSYDKNKGNRDYKKIYQENRDIKREQGRKYYAENKENILEKQKDYRQSSNGRKVMNKAHAKRKKYITKNTGIPYTREMVIDRDKEGGEFPICCLCNEVITKDSNLHMEHLIPITLGGKDCFTNVGCAHELCNLRKSKDARELTAEQVERVIDRAEKYIANHPEYFPGF